MYYRIRERERVDLSAGSCVNDKHPEHWYSTDPDERERAAWICMGCPVRSKCEDKARREGEQEGTWGGRVMDVRLLTEQH